MTVTAVDLLLEATDVSKTYGSVVALKSASLAVRPGEVHALMGANGAGKSTLVKILTGVVRPDTGRIVDQRPGEDVRLAGGGASQRDRLGLPGTVPDPRPGHRLQSEAHQHAGRRNSATG